MTVGSKQLAVQKRSKEPAQPQRRKTLRLSEYDYSSPGAYFVTICVNGKRHILGTIVGEEIHLSKVGEIVQEVWHNLSRHYENIELDEFIVMPNHVHGIIWILSNLPSTKSVGAGLRPAQSSREGLRPSPTKITQLNLPEIIRAFKSFSAREINKTINSPDKFSWQRSYHDHVIRNDDDLNQHRAYIQNNPLKWAKDEYYL
ncbi:MAG: transposase [Chloroflexi bacterium]|nr:transposase [Chloroflexota bacterium]